MVRLLAVTGWGAQLLRVSGSVCSIPHQTKRDALFLNGPKDFNLIAEVHLFEKL